MSRSRLEKYERDGSKFGMEGLAEEFRDSLNWNMYVSYSISWGKQSFRTKQMYGI